MQIPSRYRNYEPHIIQIHDKREADPTLLGDLQLHDMETGEFHEVTVSENLIRRYKKKFASFLDEIKRYHHRISTVNRLVP